MSKKYRNVFLCDAEEFPMCRMIREALSKKGYGIISYDDVFRVCLDKVVVFHLSRYLLHVSCLILSPPAKSY